MADTVQGHEAVGGATKRGAPDPNVKVPPAVRAAADRAEALAKQASEARAAQTASGADLPIGATLRPPVPNASPTNVITADFDPSSPAPPDPNDPRLQSRTTPPPSPPQPPSPQTPEDWEHQFKSLKGRYDRETEDKRRLSQQVIDMQRLMAHMGPPPLPANSQSEGSGVRFPVAPPPPGRWVKPKEVSEYGEELMDVVGRRAVEVYEPTLQQVLSELQQVKRQIGGVQNTVAYDAQVQMYRDLAKEVPNWETINNHPAFLNWLDQIDPISRQTRRSFLNAAHNSNQTGQVVDIFKGFISDVAARSPSNGAGQGPGNGAGYAPASTPQFDLMQFAAPGRAKTGQTTVPPEKPIYSRADINQFYRDKTSGKFVGREAEADAFERQLFEAGNEGRIR